LQTKVEEKANCPVRVHCISEKQAETGTFSDDKTLQTALIKNLQPNKIYCNMSSQNS
jgi:hypothetical protein